MKKPKTFLLLLFFTALSYSQNGSSISVIGGITNKDFKSFEGKINYNIANYKSNFEIGISHSIFNDESYVPIQFSITNLELGYMYSLINNTHNSFIFSFGAGVMGGYETINPLPDYLVLSESGFAYGGYGSGQIDYYISDRVDLIIRGQEYYYLKSSTGKLNPLGAIGIKINFN